MKPWSNWLAAKGRQLTCLWGLVCSRLWLFALCASLIPFVNSKTVCSWDLKSLAQPSNLEPLPALSSPMKGILWARGWGDHIIPPLIQVTASHWGGKCDTWVPQKRLSAAPQLYTDTRGRAHQTVLLLQKQENNKSAKEHRLWVFFPLLLTAEHKLRLL